MQFHEKKSKNKYVTETQRKTIFANRALRHASNILFTVGMSTISFASVELLAIAMLTKCTIYYEGRTVFLLAMKKYVYRGAKV